MSTKLLALDIREDGVCAVLVRTGLKESRFEAYAHIPFDEAADPDTRLERAVAQVAERIDPAGAFCLVSIPPADVSFRNLSVPFQSRKKIRQILPFELEPTLPFEVDQMHLDFLMVRQDDHSDLIAAAVEKGRLEHIREVLGHHGISPGFITTGGVTAALCVARLFEPRPEAFLFVESHPYSATVSIVVSGEIHLVRTFRKTAGTDADSAARDLSRGIGRMIAAFETIYDADLHPEKLLLSGGDAADARFVDVLGEALQIEAVSVDLATETRMSLSVPEDVRTGPELNGAISLVGIETARLAPFNFGRRQTPFEKYWNENRTQMIATGIIAAFVFILFMAYAILDAHYIEKRISVLDRRISEIYQSTFPESGGAQYDPVEEMKQRLDQIKGKSGMSADKGADIDNIDILRDISRLVPAQTDLVMTRFVRDQGGVQLSGLTNTFNAVDDIKMQLEKSELLNTITISSANMDKAANRIRFRIKAELAADGS